MRISPNWLREFVDLKVDDRQLADDLTLAGVAVESVKEIDGRLLFEMEIGANRPDAMCHYGVARECSAIYDIDLKPIRPRLPKAKAAAPFPIEIQDAEGCKRYTARVVRNVKIGPSPNWMLERLRIDDHNGVSNAVDASNYTLMELGHPTHAFDLDKLEGGKIIVRRARAGETLKTLDGVERKLDSEDLIIADAVRPVGLAGVMGGFDTAISGSTKNILIESAWFDPATVRKTARRLGMHTDASHIFERGADWAATVLACNRVAELILETAGGELEGEAVDAIAGHLVRHDIWLRRSEILRHLGQEVPDKKVQTILRRLGFGLKSVKGEMPEKVRQAIDETRGESPEKRAAVIESAAERTGLGTARVTELIAASKGWGPSWMIELPTWRLDIEREIDVIEEIARIYGYNKFANTLPSFSGGVIELPDAAKEHRMRSELLALGYNEAISPTFISPEDAKSFSNAAPVILANPLSEEQSAMRTSLVPGMLDMLAWNLNRGTSNVQLFELGHIFELNGEITKEKQMICFAASRFGLDPESSGGFTHVFRRLKGDVGSLLEKFDCGPVQLEVNAGAYYHPNRSARLIAKGESIARFGVIHPDIMLRNKFKQEILLAEIDLSRLFKFDLKIARYSALPKFPAVERDFSFIFPDSVLYETISSAVSDLKITELKTVWPPFKILRKEKWIPEGHYSILLRARFQSSERTLRDDEVAQRSGQIIKALEGIGGSLRS